MARALVLLALASLSACAGAGRALREDDDARLRARIAARARSHLGHAGAFRVGADRFGPDCAGFVEAVYEAEGVPLRRLMRESAPRARSGVLAAWRAMERYGAILPRDAPPEPGDLVFWHDTWDRNGDGRRGDHLTHMGVVLWVDEHTVAFAHRGSNAVAQGAMTVARRAERRAPDERELNTPLRRKTRRGRDGPVLAAELLAGYGRLDPSTLR